MSDRPVLILSHPDDAHAAAVAQALRGGGAPVWWADIPQVGHDRRDLVVNLRPGATARIRLGAWDLTQVGCAWQRRPSALTGGPQAHREELGAAIGGALAGLPWLNPPAAMAVAGWKTHQLITAASVGLSVPETLITTDAALGPVMARQRAVVVKPISPHGRPFLVGAEGRQGWGRPASMTQELVDKVADVRLTVVDETMVAVAIRSPHLDWRTDESACSYEMVDVPPRLCRPVMALMARLGLRYAALDFALGEDGAWWFLEANPNGQWLWLDERAGTDITGAVAGALRR